MELNEHDSGQANGDGPTPLDYASAGENSPDLTRGLVCLFGAAVMPFVAMAWYLYIAQTTSWSGTAVSPMMLRILCSVAGAVFIWGTRLTVPVRIAITIPYMWIAYYAVYVFIFYYVGFVFDLWL